MKSNLEIQKIKKNVLCSPQKVYFPKNIINSAKKLNNAKKLLNNNDKYKSTKIIDLYKSKKENLLNDKSGKIKLENN